MEKQSYIAPGQVIMSLVVIRLLFSTTHFISLHAGRSIQDVLLALPISFLISLLSALPLLALLRHHRGKDPIECAINLYGRGAGIVTGLLYFLFFAFNNWMTQTVFQFYFIDNVISEMKSYGILLPLLVIAVYAVYRGAESITRFGRIVFIIFALVMVVLAASLIPSIPPSVGARFLLPLFYNGPGIFLKELMAQFNSGMQIINLAFFAPFFRSGVKLGKVYLKWNIITYIMIGILFTLCVAVLGPFGANQFFPLQYLAAQSTISVFDRLDSLFSMSWMLNVILEVMINTYLQTRCIVRMGWNKHQLLLAAVVGAFNTAIIYFMVHAGETIFQVTLNWYWLGFNVLVILVLPLILLIGDQRARGGKMAHEAA